MAPIFGENPYLVDGEDVRGSVYMKGAVDGQPIQTWIPKENVAEARKAGLVPTEFVVRQTRRAGGKDIVSERKLPANVYANVPATGFGGAVASDPLGSALMALAGGGRQAPGPSGGQVVPTEQATGGTPMREALQADLTQSGMEAAPLVLQALISGGVPLSGWQSLLGRAALTLGGQTGVKMVEQKMEGEKVDHQAAMTRGGFLGNPVAMTTIGAVADAIPFLARASGRRLVKGGLGPSPIGAEEQIMEPSMRLRVMNPVTGKVELQSPRPTVEWTKAATEETTILGNRNQALAKAASEGADAPKFDPLRLRKVVEDDIRDLKQTDILSGGPEQVSQTVMERLEKVLGIKIAGALRPSLQAEPITMDRLFAITRKAGDYASSAMQARLAAAKAGNAMPEADAMEVIARKLWAEGKAMMAESGGAGQAIAANAERQFRLIETNNLMKHAGTRSLSPFELLTPRGSIPVGTSLMQFGMQPSIAPILQGAGATAPLFNALNPPRQQSATGPIPIMGE